jgi:hypothetical protein
MDRDADTPPQFGWSRAAQAGLTFRAITDADLPFLVRLYASTRTEELAVTDWSDAQKAAFLQMQFDAQHTHYQKHYAGSDFLVIERGSEAIGRLYLARRSTHGSFLKGRTSSQQSSHKRLNNCWRWTAMNGERYPRKSAIRAFDETRRRPTDCNNLTHDL